MSQFVLTSIKRNTLLNLAGSGFPILLSVVTVPLYLRLIGNAYYGALAIVWVLLGYFGLFDLGTGRAIANQIAKLRNASPQAIERSFWTALLLNMIFGMLGGCLMFIVGQVMFGILFKVPAELLSEVLSALPWLSVAVPLITASTVLTGALEGQERFLIVNVLGMSTTVLFQIVPLIVAFEKGPNLAWLIISIVSVLFVSTLLALLACIRYLPLREGPQFDIRKIGPFFRYGGWITVSGLVNPYLLRLDLFMIGTQLGIQAVPQYSIPYNLVIPILMLPISLSRALFPRFSTLRDNEVYSVERNSYLGLAAIITPGIVLGLVLLKPILVLWLGPPLANDSAPVGQILLLGIWFNSLAAIPFTLLQSRGRPDLTAKFHFIELGPYLLALWLGMTIAGVRGAACAWVLRIILDTTLLYRAAGIPRRQLLSLAYSAILVVSATISSLTLFTELSGRLWVGGTLVLISLIWACFLVPWDLKLIIQRLSNGWADSRYDDVRPSDELFK